jgi:nicotinamidase-related amidase
MTYADTAAKTRWFSRDTSALVLIDHQVGTTQLVKNIASDVAVRNAAILAKAGRTLEMPIVMTASIKDHIQGPLAAAPEAYDARVKRVGIVNAWADSHFKAAVEASGRRQLVMAGVTTDICLVFPSISAVKDGYQEVQAVMDASGSPFELSENMARRRMERAGVVLTATNTIIAELVQDWATPEGETLVQYLLFSAPMMPPIA